MGNRRHDQSDHEDWTSSLRPFKRSCGLNHTRVAHPEDFDFFSDFNGSFNITNYFPLSRDYIAST